MKQLWKGIIVGLLILAAIVGIFWYVAELFKRHL
jgi:hypothetical protein